jgi:threonine aldolase
MHFASDNTTPIHPRVMAALASANEGHAMPYGDDDITARAKTLLREVFGAVAVHFVTTGTAANALALSALTPPWGGIVCHREAHVHTDECGAPEFFTAGAKLLPVEGDETGRLSPDAISALLAGFVHGVHQVRPTVLSITNATELGGVYTPRDIARLSEVARAAGLRLHMDGARLANALAATGATPREMTAATGVDALSFGLTKNGAMLAEAVLLFDTGLAEEFDRRQKRAGQLVSKARFLAAQFLALMEDNLWLRLAAHANAMAARLATGLRAVPGARLLNEPRGNEIFVWLPAHRLEGLRSAGATFYTWRQKQNEALVRLVTSWATRPEEIEALLSHLRD